MNQKEKLINSSIIINIIALIINIFYFEKWLVFVYLILNIALIASYKIIQKYDYVFEGLVGVSQMAKKLNDSLEINNQ
ncbi:MAG: hypothetical protein ACOC56_03480 [Atribacterota bacterium]